MMLPLMPPAPSGSHSGGISAATGQARQARRARHSPAWLTATTGPSAKGAGYRLLTRGMAPHAPESLAVLLHV